MLEQECPRCRIKGFVIVFDNRTEYELHIANHNLENIGRLFEKWVQWFEKASQHMNEETANLR